ncbi:DUF4383 domain-containing protein [Streptomyces sp. DSM 44917]|uniref:DUF4383 domain-containing protein n=1 Tax=Streptomyces boetiae TaxID=3075541 RepID=A0ABU2L3A5_9ACTN|nr:DUF4383 domain-containing protein [Streptomyces sp. DSM 44917]MDT0306047.1 DUF4383 domain-containing protein [Streptomyces sp. DSM 44917]
MATYTARDEPRLPHTGPRGLLRRARLDEHLPVDRRLSRVYRIGAGLMGLGLVIFGVRGVTAGIGMFDTGDESVWGLKTNGALGLLSIVVGLLLFAGMLRGGNVASSLNLLIGVAFVLSGFVNLALLETEANVLNFGMPNVIFSFAVGLVLMTFGMYGRVSGRLPHDNPYWKARNPQADAEEGRRRELVERRRRELSAGASRRAAHEGR